MNIASQTAALPAIGRTEPGKPILATICPRALAIRAGTTITAAGMTHVFKADEPVELGDLISGEDYGIRLDGNGKPFASLLGPENPIDAGWLAGFHFAPGGNADARAGGDSTPAINPHSIWDIGFRPACSDPRGMTLVEIGERRFWIDIYLLGTEHKRYGTSRCGATIADGASLDRLNYHDAVAIYAGHGKRLPTYDEFRTAASGVTEKSSAARDPKTTGLDAARTSRFGLMQATGNLWQWGTDGDPDDPRPSVFGGSWFYGAFAGSRFANLDLWPEFSFGHISARGACDHLDPA